MNDYDYLAQLPGQEREQNWIRERLKTLSVREDVVLAAATLRHPPESAMAAINQLQSLDYYGMILDAGSYEALGEARYQEIYYDAPQKISSYINYERFGEQYEDEHPGLFAGNCYVMYPEQEPKPAYQGGDAPLPVDDQWTVKVKLASPAEPDGVWLRLPSQGWGPLRYTSDDEELALKQLGVRSLDDCTLLDAVCILPQVEDLAREYDNIHNLVNDGECAAHCLQLGSEEFTDFAERYAAAMAMENTHTLTGALAVARNIGCYDWMPSGSAEDYAAQYLRKHYFPDSFICSDLIDLKSCGVELLEQEGYTALPDNGGYIRRNERSIQYGAWDRDKVLADHNLLAKLPGTTQEQDWVRERLETLSVREGLALDAAIHRKLPKNAVDAINCLQTLEYYEVRPNTGNNKALGMFYLQSEAIMPDSALPFVDLEQMGQQYREKHPGLFLGDCYVEHPDKDVQPVYQGQGILPEDKDWSVKLKVASPAVPEGVWLRLPGPFQEGLEGTVEEALALQALHIQRWDECALLDARCVLPEAGNLTEQYDDVGDLIYDGIELGYVLDQKGQGMPDFMARFAAALELEGCRNLKLALDISQNLNCYDWVSGQGLEDYAAQHLLKKNVPDQIVHSGSIDLNGYATELLEQQGYRTDLSETGCIRRNDQEFFYQYSTPTPEQSGMMMQ